MEKFWKSLSIHEYKPQLKIYNPEYNIESCHALQATTKTGFIK